MENDINVVYKIIDNFLRGEINAAVFEKNFSDFFDFFDFPDPCVNYNYLSNIREILEHYSSSSSDIKKHPNYYIGSEQLQEKILKLTQM